MLAVLCFLIGAPFLVSLQVVALYHHRQSTPAAFFVEATALALFAGTLGFLFGMAMQ